MGDEHHPITRTGTRRALGQTWQAREGEKVWQKAVYEQAGRLVRLHEGIEALEKCQASVVPIDLLTVLDTDPLAPAARVSLPRVRLLELLRTLEAETMEDMARILRQVTE